jgi:pantoate--beta-alanine ligase
MKSVIEKQKKVQHSIGFVPTMGYLHEGHLSLVRIARRKTDFVVVSIFVNPTQFGPGEDYARYPRNLKKDVEVLKQEKAHAVFKPSVRAMYAPDYETTVKVEKMSTVMCGHSRPHHFQGVTTVVLKLFNIVEPDIAVFGRKDFQQGQIIKRMIEDLNLSTKIILGPIIREHDGLAMSSRNVYLNPNQRKNATVLYQSLQWVKAQYKQGLRDASKAIIEISKMITNAGARIDYVDVVNAHTLHKVNRLGKGTLIALAVFFGKTRLIDNTTL